MDEELHDDALARGLVRYCPICDGYEVTDKRVGVIGSDSHGVAEAIFLRSYTPDVTLIAPDKALRPRAQRTRQAEAMPASRCIDGPAQAVAIRRLHRCRHRRRPSRLRQRLSGAWIRHAHRARRDAGRQLADDGCYSCDDHQRTSVPGLYAAGDVVHGLDQISHAMGEGGVAATTSATTWLGSAALARGQGRRAGTPDVRRHQIK